MRLRTLFEALSDEVAIIFGRFNPPHKGHRAAWEIASQSPHWYVGTNQATQGAKDPLPYDIKLQAMTAVWPGVEGHIVAEVSWLTMASMVYEKHKDSTLLCLTDEDWVTKTIQQYNGKEGSHGFYNFKNIEQRTTPRLSSATALRDAVTQGDRDAFTRAAGIAADTPVAGKEFFDLVAEYLLPLQAAAVKKTPKKKSKTESVVNELAELTRNYYTLSNGKMVQVIYRPNVNQSPIPLTGVKVSYVNPALRPQGGSFDSTGQAERWDSAPDGVKQAIEKFVRQPKQGVAEGSSTAMAHAAKRLTDPKDGATAKLRAAGDKRREDQLKSRNIAKKNEAVAEARQSVQVKLAKAWDQQKAKSDASRQRGKELLNPSKKEQPNDEKKNEEAAGVGIITKQNTTKDVNKGTLRKMMKGYKLI